MLNSTLSLITNYVNKFNISPQSIGLVTRSHSGGYNVYNFVNNRNYLCVAKKNLKKQRINILTGDIVQFETIDNRDNNESGYNAIITERIERITEFSKPPIANCSQVMLIQSIKQPNLNLNLLNKLIVHFEIQSKGNVRPLICFNKIDLNDDEELLKELITLYSKLEYKVFPISVSTGFGITNLLDALQDKMTVVAGPSGVGKSSLLNCINSSLQLNIADKLTDYGRHTTTCTQFYTVDYNGNKIWVADSPGFNLNALDCPEPIKLASFFSEINFLAQGCRFKNCLHTSEIECNVIKNIDKINPSRFQSYKELVAQANILYKSQKDVSKKNESSIKLKIGKNSTIKQVVKIKKAVRQNIKSKTRQIDYNLDLDL